MRCCAAVAAPLFCEGKISSRSSCDDQSLDVNMCACLTRSSCEATAVCVSSLSSPPAAASDSHTSKGQALKREVRLHQRFFRSFLNVFCSHCSTRIS